MITLPTLDLGRDGIHLTEEGYKVLIHIILTRLKTEMLDGNEVTLPDWTVPRSQPRPIGRSRGEKGLLYRKRKRENKLRAAKPEAGAPEAGVSGSGVPGAGVPT